MRVILTWMRGDLELGLEMTAAHVYFLAFFSNLVISTEGCTKIFSHWIFFGYYIPKHEIYFDDTCYVGKLIRGDTNSSIATTRMAASS
jgi:hypothetical protein